jgi:hypothetical protein
MKRTTKKVEAEKSNRNTYIILSLSCIIAVLARSYDVKINVTGIEKPTQEDVNTNFHEMRGRPIQEDFTMDFDDENYVYFGQRKPKAQDKPRQEDVNMNFHEMAGRPIQEDFTMDFDDPNYVYFGQRKPKAQDKQEIQEEGKSGGRKLQEKIVRKEMEEKVDILSVMNYPSENVAFVPHYILSLE